MEIATIEREWKENNKYGPSIEKKAKLLFENRPIGVTDCLLSSSKYMLKFNKKKTK